MQLPKTVVLHQTGARLFLIPLRPITEGIPWFQDIAREGRDTRAWRKPCTIQSSKTLAYIVRDPTSWSKKLYHQYSPRLMPATSSSSQ